MLPATAPMLRERCRRAKKENSEELNVRVREPGSDVEDNSDGEADAVDHDARRQCGECKYWKEKKRIERRGPTDWRLRMSSADDGGMQAVRGARTEKRSCAGTARLGAGRGRSGRAARKATRLHLLPSLDATLACADGVAQHC